MPKTTSMPTVVEPVDNELVEQAYQKIYEIFSANVEKAMYNSGKYLLETFYDNDIERARKKDSPKKESLNQLIKRLQSNSVDSPSKSWIYNSIGLILQKKDIENLADEKCFHAYGILPLSHKTRLLSVKDMDKKILLINEIEEKGLSVREVDQRKKELIPNNPENTPLLTLLNSPDKAFDKENKAILSQRELKKLTGTVLNKIKSKALKKAQDLEKVIKQQATFIEKYQKLSSDINELIKTKS